MTRRNSVQWRVTVVAGLTTALALLVAGIAIHLLARTMLYQQFDADLLARARTLASLVKPDPRNARPEVDLFAAGATVDLDMGFQLWTADGTLLSGDQDVRPWATVSAQLDHRVGRVQKFTVELDGARPARLLQVRLPPRPVPEWAGSDLTLVIVLIRPVDEVEGQLLGLDLLLLSVLVVVSVATAGILTWIITRELRPITGLATEIAQVTRANLHQALSSEGRRDEIAPVVAHLNALLGRIDAAMHRERRFSAAAAHELRTPLAGLRANLEVAQLDPGLGQGERARTDLCLDIVLQMQQLVDSMLLMARLDSGQVIGQSQVVRLAELVQEVAGDAAARLADRGQRLAIDVAESLDVRTDPALLRQVLTNLLGNAIDHGASPGNIAIQASARADGATELAIRNDGSRIRPQDLPQVFERFWRGDGGTVRHEGQHHCGLGLALCRDIVGVLGGRIEAQSTFGESFTIRLILPG